MTSFRVQLPEEFDFRRQEEWLKWSRRFERFLQSSGLVKEKEESQINTFQVQSEPPRRWRDC